MLRRGDEDKVVEWLESVGYSRGKSCDGEEILVINHALQEAVQHNKLSIANLLLEYGASTYQNLWL